MNSHIVGQPGNKTDFYKVLVDFTAKTTWASASYCAGDVILRGINAHTTTVRIASPTQPTRYDGIGGFWSINDWEYDTPSLLARGLIRHLTIEEFQKIEPHLTQRIWLMETQYGFLERKRAWAEKASDEFKLAWPHGSKVWRNKKPGR